MGQAGAEPVRRAGRLLEVAFALLLALLLVAPLDAGEDGAARQRVLRGVAVARGEVVVQMVVLVRRVAAVRRVAGHEAVGRAGVAAQLAHAAAVVARCHPAHLRVGHRLPGREPVEALLEGGVSLAAAGDALHVAVVGAVVAEGLEVVGAVDNPRAVGVVAGVAALLHGAEALTRIDQRVELQRVGSLQQHRVELQPPVLLLERLGHRDDEFDVDFAVALDQVAAVRGRDDHLVDGHRNHLLAGGRVDLHRCEVNLGSVLTAEGDDAVGRTGRVDGRCGVGHGGTGRQVEPHLRFAAGQAAQAAA